MTVLELLMQLADDTMIAISEEPSDLPEYVGTWKDVPDLMQYECCVITDGIRFVNGFLHIKYIRLNGRV